MKNLKPKTEKQKKHIDNLLLDFETSTYQSGEENYDEEELDEDSHHNNVYVEAIHVSKIRIEKSANRNC